MRVRWKKKRWYDPVKGGKEEEEEEEEEEVLRLRADMFLRQALCSSLLFFKERIVGS